jgi:hypothetical protein
MTRLVDHRVHTLAGVLDEPRFLETLERQDGSTSAVDIRAE